MTVAEAELCQLLALQSWSYLLNLLATGSPQQLQAWINNPGDFLQHKDTTAWVNSDAVPVYLDVSIGKILLDSSRLRNISKGKREKGNGKRKRGNGKRNT